MMKFILNNWRKFFALSLTIPIFFNLAIYLYSSNIFSLLISINITYYLMLIALLFYAKNYHQDRKKPRSPFYFIKAFNTTGQKIYWDEYQQPLRHLIGVEIGVDSGNHAEKIINYLNLKKIYLVDPWKEYINKDLGEIDYNQKFHDERYEFVKKRFQKNTKVEIIRKSSVDASKLFTDNYFDFIYIDGDHSYEAVKMDLNHWHPKLKKYGVMCGDDFGHISGRGVIEAVQEFSFQKKLIIQTVGDTQFWYVKTND